MNKTILVLRFIWNFILMVFFLFAAVKEFASPGWWYIALGILSAFLALTHFFKIEKDLSWD